MLRRVCAILDLECFQHKQLLFYREVGFIPISDFCTHCFETSPRAGEDIFSTAIYPPFVPSQRDSALWRTFRTLTYRVHGLGFVPDSNYPSIPHDHLQPLLQGWYDGVKTSSRYLIAYKGGVIEKNLLYSLGIPSLDLEKYHIPPFHSLSANDYRWYDELCCNQHHYLENTVRVNHCPRMEVAYLRDIMVQKEREEIEDLKTETEQQEREEAASNQQKLEQLEYDDVEYDEASPSSVL